MKSFHGRVLFPGTYKGEVVVSHQGFNILASMEAEAFAPNTKEIVSKDHNNPEIYDALLTGKALALPECIGSTTGGVILQTVSVRKLGPVCYLFAKEIDSLAASGTILSNVYNDCHLVVIDSLGSDFLQSLHSGDRIEVKEDGNVLLMEGQE